MKLALINPSKQKSFPDICGKIIELARTKKFSIAVVEIEKNKETGSHFHRKMIEVYHILKGKGIFYHRGKNDRKIEILKLKEDLEVIIPPAIVHQTKAKTKMKILVVTSPPFDTKDIFEEPLMK